MNCIDIYSTALVQFVHKPAEPSNYMWHNKKVKTHIQVTNQNSVT